jgi:hypothetical protein
MKKRLTAIKSFRYSTRAIRAGDVFDIGARDAKVLIALGRAVRYAEREPAVVPPPPAGLVVTPRDALLERAKSVGLTLDKRWSDATLAKRIEEAEAAS